MDGPGRPVPHPRGGRAHSRAAAQVERRRVPVRVLSPRAAPARRACGLGGGGDTVITSATSVRGAGA